MKSIKPPSGLGMFGRGIWLPPLLIVAVYVAAVLLVDPRGEFPLNDDWAYTRSAFRLGAGSGVQIDEWAAPSLVGQALYGGLVSLVSGPRFLPLRVTTLLLSCSIAMLLWFWLREMGTRGPAAWVALLAWVFNPIQFWLSFTFMTEIPFLFFVMAGIFLLTKARSRGTYRFLIASAACLGYAYLIRQTALLFILAGIVTLLVADFGAGMRNRIRSAAVWGLTAGSFVLVYHGWAALRGGFTPATLRKFELLQHLSSTQLLANFFGLLFYVAFMLTPLWVVHIRSFCDLLVPTPRRALLSVLAVWIMVAGTGIWWFRAHYSRPTYLPSAAFHGQMPFLLNILYDTGLGPITLDPTYYGPPPTPVYPKIWSVITLLTAVGLVILGTVCLHNSRRLRDSSGWRREILGFLILSFVGIAAFEVIFSHQQEGGLFDRHILATALPALLLAALVEPSGCVRRQRAGSHMTRSPIAFLTAAGMTIGILGWFCVTATHDYMSWNRLRWKIGTGLLAKGVDPLVVSGGFEFNAWHNYDKFRARGGVSKIYYWWYDDLEYLIAMEPQERYAVRSRLLYFSWLHRRALPVYLLQREQR